MNTDSTTDEIQHIRQRLDQLEHRLAEVEISEEETRELADEEHRLEARLRELTDSETEEIEGIAEQLVKSEGGNADDLPSLPNEPPR